MIVGAGMKTGVNLLMDNPREMGSDRIVTVSYTHLPIYIGSERISVFLFFQPDLFDADSLLPLLFLVAERLFLLLCLRYYS